MGNNQSKMEFQRPNLEKTIMIYNLEKSFQRKKRNSKKKIEDSSSAIFTEVKKTLFPHSKWVQTPTRDELNQKSCIVLKSI